MPPAFLPTSRYDKSYAAVRLSDVPHRRLTKPKKVTEVFFDGSDADAPPLEAALKLEVTESGLLNAVVFWFDLHMDEQDTLTNAPAGVGKGGQVLGRRGGDEPRKKRSGKVAEASAAPDASEAAGGASVPPGSSAAATQGADAGEATTDDSREAATPSEAAAEAAPAEVATTEEAPAAAAADGHDADALALALAPAADTTAAERAAQREAERHYWGQALQYFERAVVVRAQCLQNRLCCALSLSRCAPPCAAHKLPRVLNRRRRACGLVQVHAGKKVTVLAKTEAGKVHYRRVRRRPRCRRRLPRHLSLLGTCPDECTVLSAHPHRAACARALAIGLRRRRGRSSGAAAHLWSRPTSSGSTTASSWRAIRPIPPSPSSAIGSIASSALTTTPTPLLSHNDDR